MFILKKGHQPGVYVPLRALFLVKYSISKKMCTVPKKVFLLCQSKRGNLYHCSQLERLLSYFSSLCVLLMLDSYGKENYRDMLNAGVLDNKVLEIL